MPSAPVGSSGDQVSGPTNDQNLGHPVCKLRTGNTTVEGREGKEDKINTCGSVGKLPPPWGGPGGTGDAAGGQECWIPVPSLPRVGCAALIKAHTSVPQLSVSPSVGVRGLTPGKPRGEWGRAKSEAILGFLPSSPARSWRRWVLAAEGIQLPGAQGRPCGLWRPLRA